MTKLNPVASEPVLLQALATLIVWAATRYGLHISDEQALQIAGGAFIVLAPFVRQLVRPLATQPQGEVLPPISPQPTIQVHVAGTDPAKVADEVGRQLKRHVNATPATGGVVTGGHPDPISRRPVKDNPQA